MTTRSRKIAAAFALAASSLLLQGNLGRTTNLDARLLAAHNRERTAADIPALAWDARLAADAAAWGQEMAATGEFEHSPNAESFEDAQGENLFMGTTGAYSPEFMVGSWIEEKKDFKPGIFPDNSRTGDLEDVGHYTQLMWRETGRVGCAVARGEEDEYLVCRYSQVGNVEGERPF